MDIERYPYPPQAPQRSRRGVPTVVWAAIIALLVVVCAVFFLLWQITVHRYNKMVDIGKISQVLEMFDRYSVEDSPSRDELTDIMLEAALAAYGDRYAAYYTKEEFSAWQSDLSGSFCGIGVVTLWQEGEGLLILDVFPDSPAEGAGILPGDLVIGVEGRSVTVMGQAAAMEAIAGEEGTSLRLEVKHAGGSAATLTLTRAPVVHRSVLWSTVAGTNVGYVRITDFNEKTYEQFKTAVKALEQAGVKGIVFDLRDNGGGTLLSVSQMLAFLLPDGDLCYVDYAASGLSDYTIRAEGDVLRFDGSTEKDGDFRHAVSLPMTVLINRNTASAAELFSAALRDYAEAGKCSVRLVGETTYGKGTMQTTHALPDGSGIKLTVAHYDPPCGVNYDGVGLAPHMEVAQAPYTSLYLLAYADDAPLRAAVEEITLRFSTDN